MMKNVNIKFFDRFILAGYTICIGRDIVENVRHCFTKVVPPILIFTISDCVRIFAVSIRI